MLSVRATAPPNPAPNRRQSDTGGPLFGTLSGRPCKYLLGGVCYAAAAMEARLCAGSPVEAGGSNSTGEAALFLAESGSPVTMVIRGGDLAASLH